MIVDAHSHIFPRIHGLNAEWTDAWYRFWAGLYRGQPRSKLLPPWAMVCPTQLGNCWPIWIGPAWRGRSCCRAPSMASVIPYVLDALEQYSDRLVGAAYFDPWMAGSRKTFEETLASPGYCAVKLECSVPSGLCGIHPEARLDSPDLDWLWQEVGKARPDSGARLGWPLAAARTKPRQFEPSLFGIPDLKIVVAHLGQPRPEAETEPELWKLVGGAGRPGPAAQRIWFDCASLIAFVNEEGYPFSLAWSDTWKWPLNALARTR